MFQVIMRSGVLVSGGGGGGGGGVFAVKAIESILAIPDDPPASMTRRAVCTPLVNVTVRVTVCQFCQPPVLGTVTESVTLTPFISRWIVPPVLGVATRKPTV